MDAKNEICKLVIQHIDVVEESKKISDEVEDNVFTALNQYVENYIKHNTNPRWEGEYDVAVGNNERGSYFNPSNWEGSQALYSFEYSEAVKCTGVSCLGKLCGAMNSGMMLVFSTDFQMRKIQKKKWKSLLANFFQTHTELQQKGAFLFQGGTYIFFPFHLDKELVARDYPDLELDTLQPLTTVLESLLEVHTLFDSFVTELLTEFPPEE